MEHQQQDLDLKFFLVPFDDKIVNLRHSILRPGRLKSSAIFDHDEDPETLHFVGYTSKSPLTPICCVTYVLSSWGDTVAYHLRGMATDTPFQNMGVGKKLVAYAERLIRRKKGIISFWCKARIEAVGFYEKQGWVYYGNEFNIKDVGPHIKMTKGIVRL